MTFSDIKQQLMDKETLNFYIFTGDELEVQRAYINKIAESKSQIVQRIDTISEISKYGNTGLLKKSFCFVCRDDAEFQKTESAWDKIDALVKDNTLIYQVTKLDKRGRFYNRWEQQIVVFDYMPEPVLIKHIKQQISLSTDNCKQLIHVCGGDYGRILTEIDKICQYADKKSYEEDKPFIDINNVFQTLLNDGTIYKVPDDAIFEWVKAILGGKPKQAFTLLQDCIAIGEPALRLLLVLYQNVKRLLQVQSCESRNIADTTGLTQWEINTVRDFIGVYQTWELVDALHDIRYLESGIKTGEVDEEYAVEYAMISLMGVWE